MARQRSSNSVMVSYVYVHLDWRIRQAKELTVSESAIPLYSYVIRFINTPGNERSTTINAIHLDPRPDPHFPGLVILEDGRGVIHHVNPAAIQSFHIENEAEHRKQQATEAEAIQAEQDNESAAALADYFEQGPYTG